MTAINHHQRFTIAQIQDAVAKRYRISPDKLREPLNRGLGRDGRNSLSFSRPRQVAMFLARNLVSTPHFTGNGRQPISYTLLADAFARDHSTIVHAVQRIPELAANDSELGEKIKEIRQSLGAE